MAGGIITDAWEKSRIFYQFRYAKFCRQYKENPADKDVQGHMHEASYVLISVFGLTGKQVDEIEKNYGLTNRDIEEEGLLGDVIA